MADIINNLIKEKHSEFLLSLRYSGISLRKTKMGKGKSSPANSSLKYKKNFLTDVVFRIDFPSVSLQMEGKDAPYRKAIRKIFPKLESRTLTLFKTTLTKGQKIDEQSQQPLYIFTGKSGLERLELSAAFLSISTKKYSSFKDFQRLIKSATEPLTTIYSAKIFRRVGLRYVNQIILSEGHPLEWGKYINASLLQTITTFLPKDNIARSMNQSVASFDDFRMNFAFGVFNSEFPSVVTRREFILDIDCYSEDVEPDMLFSRLDLFNTTALKYFEMSILDGLRDIMRQ